MNTQYERLYFRRVFRHDGVYIDENIDSPYVLPFCYLTTLSASWPYVVVHRMVNEYGAFTGIKIGTGIRITGSKPLPVRLYPPQIPGESRISTFHVIQAGSGVHPAFYRMGTEGRFFRGLSGRVVKLTAHLQLVPRSRERESIRPLPNTSSWRCA
jgi:hypothetical protein